MSLAADAASCPTFRKKPCVPAIAPAPPNASANPQAQYASDAIEKFMRIFATPEPAFFIREKPISRKANPACMNITSTPATITQVVLTLDVTSGRVGPLAAEAAAGSARAAASAAAQPATTRIRAWDSGAAPVAPLYMRFSHFRLPPPRPRGGGLHSWPPPHRGLS